MQKERRNVPVPTDHFLAFIPISLSACGVVAYHIEPVGKRWAFGSSIRPPERNPVPGERILLPMDPCVPTGHNPVITLGHGRILSEWKASQLAASACILGRSPEIRGKMRSSAEALGRPDPLIDSIVGNHHEDEIDDDAKQLAAHALERKWIRAVGTGVI
jgi:hypothetical protein